MTRQQLAAGGGPDIVQTDGPAVLAEMASANYLVPLDNYAQKYGWDQRFYPWALDSVKSGGHIMGVPGGYEALVVYYNKDMFDKNGWEIPTSYQELVDLCAKIQQKGTIPFAFGTQGYKAINEWWLTEAYNLTVGTEEFKKVLQGKEDWNSPVMTDATQKLVDLWQKGYINDKKSAAISSENADTLFNTGKAAMQMEGTWALRNHSENAKFQWGMFEMPAWRDGIDPNFPLGLGDATGINKNSKHPDEAAEFLNYLHSVDVAKEWLKRGTFMPINGVDADSVSGVPDKIKDAFTMLNTAMENGQTGFVAWTYWPPTVEAYAYNNIDSVFYGQTDIKTYLDNTQDVFKKAIADGQLLILAPTRKTGGDGRGASPSFSPREESVKDDDEQSIDGRRQAKRAIEL